MNRNRRKLFYEDDIVFKVYFIYDNLENSYLQTQTQFMAY